MVFKVGNGGASPHKVCKLVALPGSAAALAASTTARSHGDILRHVAGARLDPQLLALIQVSEVAMVLSNALATRWFKRGLQARCRVLARNQAASLRERSIREHLGVLASEEDGPAGGLVRAGPGA